MTNCALNTSQDQSISPTKVKLQLSLLSNKNEKRGSIKGERERIKPRATTLNEEVLEEDENREISPKKNAPTSRLETSTERNNLSMTVDVSKLALLKSPKKLEIIKEAQPSSNTLTGGESSGQKRGSFRLTAMQNTLKPSDAVKGN